MGILKGHIKGEIRWFNDDIKMYEPTDIQRSEIMEIINKSSVVDYESGNVTAEYGFTMIKFIIREITNIGSEIDEYSDEELNNIIRNGDGCIKKLLLEIQRLIEELTEESLEQQISQIKLMNSLIKVLEMNITADEMQKKFNKILKKQGVNITAEEMIKYKDEPEKITEIISNSKKKYNKKK